MTFIEPLIIEWTVTVGGNSDPAGASRHNVYTTFAEPGATSLLFSAVHFTTHGALGATTEQGTVDGIWSQFTQRVSSQTPDFTTPRLRTRDFDTVTGIIDTEGQALRYYNEFAPGSTLQEFFPFRGYSCTNDDLLRFGEGRCGTWARFMSSVLDNHGIASNEILLGVQFGSPVCPVIDPDPFFKLTDCVILVKDWEFAQTGGTSGNIFYPFRDEVADERGVAGQSVENPHPFFWDHVVIEIEIDGKATLYDPSYGIGPFQSLGAYENSSMAGF